MVFSSEDKAVIKHYLVDKGLNAYQIWKDNPEKGWDKRSVARLIHRFKENGSMERKAGSGRPTHASSTENIEDVEEMICSQEEPGTHVHPREIARELEISRSTVQIILNKSEINQFKRVKTPQMDDGARERRTVRAANLAEKFGGNPRMIERAVFQDESEFPLEIPINHQNNRVYYKGKKKDIPEKNLCHQGNRQTKKVMVSAALTWHGVTRPFFVNCKGIKVNGHNYVQHLKKQLFPAIKNVYPRNDWIFVQDGAPAHRSNVCQTFLNEKLHRRYVKKEDWPPRSPDSNPLDFYFWDRVKVRVYGGRMNKPFKNEEEMMRRIKAVWSECASNTDEIRKAMKQFVPRLEAIKDKDGYSIKTLFG